MQDLSVCEDSTWKLGRQGLYAPICTRQQANYQDHASLQQLRKTQIQHGHQFHKYHADCNSISSQFSAWVILVPDDLFMYQHLAVCTYSPDTLVYVPDFQYLIFMYCSL